MNDLIQRLDEEGDLCKNEGASDIGDLLWEAASEITRLRAEAEVLRKGAERYETVRRMSVPMFQDAYVLNRRTGKPFDEIVDDLRPFLFPAIAATKEQQA